MCDASSWSSFLIELLNARCEFVQIFKSITSHICICISLGYVCLWYVCVDVYRYVLYSLMWRWCWCWCIWRCANQSIISFTLIIWVCRMWNSRVVHWFMENHGFCAISLRILSHQWMKMQEKNHRDFFFCLSFIYSHWKYLLPCILKLES